MSDTPITDKIIADADATPETRIVFLIKHLANQCKAFERAAALSEIREPDNVGISDRWQDPRDISGGATDQAHRHARPKLNASLTLDHSEVIFTFGCDEDARRFYESASVDGRSAG